MAKRTRPPAAAPDEHSHIVEALRSLAVPIADLIPDPANARKHPKINLDGIKASLRVYGQRKPVVVNKRNGVVEAGNGTLMAAKALGWTHIAAVHVDDDPSTAAGFSIADNRTAELAEWDTDALDQILREIETGDEDLQAMLSKLAEDEKLPYFEETREIVEDEVPEPPADPITKPGDLWLLGEHRLLCGDSTKADDVARLMGGEKALLMATDPPYGVDFAGAKYNPRAKVWEGIANDKLTGDGLEAFVVAMLNAWLPFIDEQAAFYFWTAAMQEGAAAAAVRSVGLHIQSQIIWNKNCLVLGQADYHWKHENCWYAFWKGKKHRWFGERKQTTVWEVRKVANSEYVHPMQKPVELYGIPIANHTKAGEIVAEPFSGSGTQIIAAEQLGRTCYAMELSPAYVDVAITRWEQLTGKKAILSPSAPGTAQPPRKTAATSR